MACKLVVLCLALFAALLASPVHGDARLRIVAIGDSLMAGYGLARGDGLVPQLQRWLDAHGAAGVQIIDMGVSGDTTAGGRARLDWALADGARAVILELGANDMLRGIDPAEVRANLDAMLAGLAARDLPVLLVGMHSTANFGPGYKRAFDAVYPDLAEQYGAVYDPHMFDGMRGGAADFQADGLHPSAAGVARIVERFGPLVLELIARIEPGVEQ